MPSISNIGKPGQRFHEGPPLPADSVNLPDMRETSDWYWTPAVADSNLERKAKRYPAQRAVWVDCDESYDDKLLTALKPSYLWETSPGHKQAVWLLREKIQPSEFKRDGYIGMLTQALGGDKSGVDIGQLLRVPGSVHHKREPFVGKILAQPGTVYTRGQLLARVAKGLGFAPGLASDLGADEPYGDRSKVLWKFARNAAELGLAQDLTFKLIKATKWNKWKNDPDKLKEDIARAYSAQPDPERAQAKDQLEHHTEEDAELAAWPMATVGDFGKVIRTPVRWVVPNIIPEGACGLLVAAPKVGKTRIAIEMALGLATGRRPLGLQIKRQVPVGFFSLEDGEHLFATRLNEGIKASPARAQYHWDGHIEPDLTWEPPVPMSLLTNFAQVDLSDVQDLERLALTIQQYELKLVIIDTLSMAIGKSNVSDSKEMYGILKPIKDIAKQTGCAIMFIHHTRKRMFEKGETVQETILGSTALHGWSDFIMSLISPSEDTDLLRLAVQTKMGNDLHYIDSHLKIIKRPPVEEVVA